MFPRNIFFSWRDMNYLYLIVLTVHRSWILSHSQRKQLTLPKWHVRVNNCRYNMCLLWNTMLIYPVISKASVCLKRNIRAEQVNSWAGGHIFETFCDLRGIFKTLLMDLRSPNFPTTKFTNIKVVCREALCPSVVLNIQHWKSWLNFKKVLISFCMHFKVLTAHGAHNP